MGGVLRRPLLPLLSRSVYTDTTGVLTAYTLQPTNETCPFAFVDCICYPAAAAKNGTYQADCQEVLWGEGTYKGRVKETGEG